MGPRADLHGWGKSRLHWDSIPGPSNQYASRYIASAISAHTGKRKLPISPKKVRLHGHFYVQHVSLMHTRTQTV